MKADKHTKWHEISSDDVALDESRAVVARYIRDTSIEMRTIAHRAGLDLLAHILDMAAEEADAASCETAGDQRSRH